ncbi:MAG TPA: thymidylate kinase [Salinivirgaceae bacterium]|nr:thymidylate kinase [Salinivirgaceae bacterium]
MSFIVIEGLDGSGKSTQVKKVCHYLSEHNIPFEYIHFPRLEDPFFGLLIARFLRGEFGTLHSVDPYLVAMLYASDRWHAAATINDWIMQGKLVLVDRYVYSNIAYQTSKIADKEEKKKLRDWIFQLEYEQFKIPKPDINIWLDAPLAFVEKKLSSNRESEDRRYLEQNQRDIHEVDIDFQRAVYQEYAQFCTEYDDFRRLICYDEQNQMLSENTIFSMLIKYIQNYF